VGVGLIGAGRLGAVRAELLATRVPHARLVAVGGRRVEAADAVARPLGAVGCTVEELLANPAVDAVVVSATTEAHVDLVPAVAAAGKAVFCEKPAGLSLAEIGAEIAATQDAGVAFQVGFNRRFGREFAAARAAIDAGRIGVPQLLRSVSRDPGLSDRSVPPWAIFVLTLIHDFDILNFLNPGANPVSVHTTADALVAPERKAEGLLDTAVVVVRYDNGAIATAEANFSATYGYDVRAEVFGSGGMLQLGDGATSSLRLSDATGRHAETVRSDVERFLDGFAAELTEFVAAVREGREPSVTGQDAHRALSVAMAAIASYRAGGPVDLAAGKDVDARLR
jgi:myo-inositol 2-dehydrogenase/D-chiro-inositol 1-dehydrogenase